MDDFDYLYEAAAQQLPTILELYSSFEDKRPIIVFELQEQRIGVAPYPEFKATLSPRSQQTLEEQYADAKQNRRVVVFVNDSEARELASYSFDLPEKNTPRSAWRNTAPRSRAGRWR